MKVVVFGGTGDVGQIVVQKLLNSGQSVCILTRQKKDDQINLIYQVGNVLDKDTVDKLIDQDDKVVLSLGFNNSSLDTMSKGTANVISAMKKKGTKRIICMSAQGSGDSWEYMPNEFKEMVLSNDILNASFKDHTIQEEFVKQSDLDWTIVRPTEIINEKESGTFTINRPTESSRFQISNSDVAQFIVTELIENNYIKKVVMITD
ncbi:MAG: NAD(P)H-binding protein [Bacteroidetes bacterium]|nr:NAD(P)H-binding protein [Bacteroidota bacterium]